MSTLVKFRLSDRIQLMQPKHKFPGEKPFEFGNRMLSRLSQALLDGSEPPRPNYPINGDRRSFRATPETLAFLRSLQGDRSVDAVTTEALHWALDLPPIAPILNADEALVLIWQWEGRKAIPVDDVINLLRSRCSDSQAREFLFELDRQGDIRLVSNHYLDPSATPSRRRIGDRLVNMVHILPSNRLKSAY